MKNPQLRPCECPNCQAILGLRAPPARTWLYVCPFCDLILKSLPGDPVGVPVTQSEADRFSCTQKTLVGAMVWANRQLRRIMEEENARRNN